MSRVALLPSRGDPIGMKFFFHFFETVWQDEVDKLCILVNTTVEKEVVEFIKNFTTKNPKVQFMYADHPIDHGGALTEMFKATKEDIVVFVEDDSLIFKKGVVDRCCKLIEKGEVDCIGSLRPSCSADAMARARELFGLQDSEYDIGVHYWPCFFFAKRSDIAKTDLNFGSFKVDKGTYIKPLDWVATEDNCGGDTFVYFSWQMRVLGLTFLNVEQYHGNSFDFIYYENQEFMFDGLCPWLHNGTLSSAQEDIFTDDRGVPLAKRKDPDAKPADLSTAKHSMPADKREMERRIAWGLLALRFVWNECEEIKEFRNLYEKAINKYIERWNLDIPIIERSITIYKELIGI